MLHRVSSATIISCVALFFSLAGTGIAATHYLITSVSQIKPNVRHALRGATGPRGADGLPGLPGANGTTYHTTPICIIDGHLAIGHNCTDPSSPIVLVP